MNADEKRLNELSESSIGLAFRVANTLGCGSLEKVYENALADELWRAGLGVVQQCGIAVMYDAVVVGAYEADLLVEYALIIELKAARVLDNVQNSQCLDYLKATGLNLCLLINFGNPRSEIRRFASDY